MACKSGSQIHQKQKVCCLIHHSFRARFTSPSKISSSKNLTLHFPIKIDFGEILLGEVNRARCTKETFMMKARPNKRFCPGIATSSWADSSVVILSIVENFRKFINR